MDQSTQENRTIFFDHKNEVEEKNRNIKRNNEKQTQQLEKNNKIQKRIKFIQRAKVNKML